MPRYEDRDERDDPDDRRRERSWEDDRDRRDDRDSRGRYDDHDDRGRRRSDDYDRYGERPPQQEGSSPLGLWSFLISLIVGVAVVLLIVVATVMTMNAGGNLDENSPQAMIVGLGIMGGLGLAFLGLILGVIALLSPRPGKVLAILGVAFNGLILLGTLGIICIGLAAG